MLESIQKISNFTIPAFGSLRRSLILGGKIANDTKFRDRPGGMEAHYRID